MAKTSNKKKYSGKHIRQLGKGLDVGTAFIYASEKVGDRVIFNIARDAFVDMPYSDHLKTILGREGVKYIQTDNKLYVLGDDALRFANLFQRNLRRPMEFGVISPQEKEALPFIKILITDAIGSRRATGEVVYYSTPAPPVDAEFDVLYHQQIIQGILSDLGYTPKPMNEGLAVIFSELAEENFTGLGLSFGGGMVNVCLANLSVSLISFSIARGGDWIDKQVARVVNEPISLITSFKESSLDLEKKGNLSRIEQALVIYYDLLLDYVASHLKIQLEKSGIHLEKPLTIAIAGGTAKPSGFLKRFKNIIQRYQLPFALAEVYLAPQPLQATVKGTLIAAIVDEGKRVE